MMSPEEKNDRTWFLVSAKRCNSQNVATQTRQVECHNADMPPAPLQVAIHWCVKAG